MGSAASREAAAVVAAIALHVGLLLMQPRGASVFPSPRAPALSDVIELDTDHPAPGPAAPIVEAPPVEAPPAAKAGGGVEKTRASSPAPVNAKSVAIPETPVGERRVEPVEAPPLRAESPPSPSPSPFPDAAAPPPGSPRADLSQPPPPAEGALGLPPGLGGAPVWAIPGVVGPAAAGVPAPAPTAAPAVRPVDRNIAGKVIDATLHKRDHDLGLDAPAAGVVASSIADAVRSSAIPGDARASFEVRLGAGGDVEGVRLLSSTAGDAATWERVVRSAKGLLAGRALRVGPDARGGTTVVVKIESSVQYPAGSKQKLDVEPVCANEVLDAIAEALKNPGAIGAGLQQGVGGRGAVLGAGMAPPEGMYWDPARKKFCVPIGIRGRGDMSNAGAHPVNLIKSSFTVKHDGERSLPAEDVLPIDTRVPWARADPTLTRAPPPPKKKKKW